VSHKYGVTILPEAQHKQAHPTVTPASKAGTQFTYPGGDGRPITMSKSSEHAKQAQSKHT